MLIKQTFTRTRSNLFTKYFEFPAYENVLLLFYSIFSFFFFLSLVSHCKIANIKFTQHRCYCRWVCLNFISLCSCWLCIFFFTTEMSAFASEQCNKCEIPKNLSLYANLLSGKLYSLKICTFFSPKLKKKSSEYWAPNIHVCHIHTKCRFDSQVTNYKFLWCHNRWEHSYACHSNIRYTRKVFATNDWPFCAGCCTKEELLSKSKWKNSLS